MSSPTLLITGGTGFLGRHLGRSLKDDYAVVLTGRNHDQNRVAQEFTGCHVLPLDVTHLEAVRDVFAEIRPQAVVHAAASKYVDTAERQPNECIDANVLGSQNVARVAVEKGVETVVGISTDKAAPPVANTYGLTKALMERLFCGVNGKTPTRFACVRFGNMPWSTGSVFPAWKRMQETNGIIGSTGPHMTRLFSPVDEAVQLVTTTLANIEALQGRVVSRRMKAALIRDILEVWVRHRGGSWKPIEGRPGERQHEHLIGDPELLYTSEIELSGVQHYVISFNQPVAHPLASAVSSETAERFSDEEIRTILLNPPQDAA